MPNLYYHDTFIGPASGQDIPVNERGPFRLCMQTIHDLAAEKGIPLLDAEHRLRQINAEYHVLREEVKLKMKGFQLSTGIKPVLAKFEVWIGPLRITHRAFVDNYEELVKETRR